MRRWLLAIWALLKSLARKVTEMPRRYLPDQELVIIEDDFDEMADYGREHQVPGAPTPPPPKGWEALCRGKTIGKTGPIRFATGAIFSSPSVNLFEVSAENGDAMELSVLLSTPKFAPALSFALVPNIENFKGPWQDNVDIMNMTPAQIAAAYGINGPLLGDAKAEITWGTGGIDHRAIVDMHNGAGIIINASFVRIRAFIAPREFNSASDMFYLLGAQIAPGVSKYLGAQFTQPLGSIDENTESEVRAVPRFARRVHLAGGNNDIVPGPLFAGRIRFWRNATGPALNSQMVGEYRFTANSADAGPVRIPNGAYFYTVISEINAAAVTLRIFAIFDLAI